MEVKDLVAKQGNVDIVVKVVSIDAAREFSKFGRTGRVANATAKDETGEVKLTLWNDQIDQVKAGDTIKITNGYVNEWQGEKQLTTGRQGTLEVESSDGQEPEESSDNEDDESESPKKRKTAPKKASAKEKEESDSDDSEDDVDEEDLE